MNQRTQKANQILSQLESIRKITTNQFKVNSQSDSTKSYLVKKLLNTDIWTCECADFHYRLRTKDDKHCKHIKSVILLKDKVNTENNIESISIELPKICPKCYSTTIKKCGFRKME